MNALTERIQSLSGRERRMIFLTATVMLIGLGYIYIGEPVYLRWNELHTESQSLQKDLKKLRGLSQNRELIEENFAKVQDSIPAGNSQENLEVRFLEEINALAHSSGLRVGSLKPLKIERSGRFDQLQVQVHGSCQGYEFTKFLQLLQDEKHLIQCTDITLTAGRSRPPLTVTLTLSKLVMRELGAGS